jgi:3alpha(or 20beta)-hydroxysteroid dehydrogenase
MGRMDGKVAIVSGGAGGLGRSHAEVFIAEGGRVVLADLPTSDVRDIASQLGDAAVGVELDVRSQSNWERVLLETRRAFGEPNVLVNNAGVVSFAPLFETSEEEYRRVIDINQLGVFLGMRVIGPAIVAAGGGAIVNIASVEGLVGSAGLVSYSASKHAVIGMTKAAALELVSTGVRVNAVAPGAVFTAMLDEVSKLGLDPQEVIAATHPLGRAGTLAEISAAVLYLASDESSYCTGTTLAVDGGVTAQ